MSDYDEDVTAGMVSDARSASELKRYEVRLYAPNGGKDVHTFTWGRNYNEAYIRAAHLMDASVYDDWQFAVVPRDDEMSK